MEGKSMFYGVRTGLPLAIGLIIGVLLSLSVLNIDDDLVLLTTTKCSLASLQSPSLSLEDELSSEHWEVIVKKLTPISNNMQQQSTKFVRPRFVASELGIREKLMVIIFGQSSLSLSLNMSLAKYVPRVHIFVDAAQFSIDLSNSRDTTIYRSNGQHAHIVILNNIFNMRLIEQMEDLYDLADVFYADRNVYPDQKEIKLISWNKLVAISGYLSGNGNNDDHGCVLESGILLSYPAMKTILERRSVCNSIVMNSDYSAFEECIHRAMNRSCINHENAVGVGGDISIHDAIMWWSSSPNFNKSLSVSPLLSDSDANTLHQHFISVELDCIDREIDKLVTEIEISSYDIADGPTWPAAVSPYSRPLNRHQVAKWQYFTNVEIFKNELDQNMELLSGEDKSDILEVIAAAREFAESKSGPAFNQEFLQMRNGYRLFDPVRGMDYILDLMYLDGNTVVHRIHLVPYVKEDTDLTIVIPLGSNEEVRAVRYLLARFIRLCSAAVDDPRQTRLVVAVRGVNPSAIRLINNDIIELRIQQTMLLILKSDSHPVIAAAALDEAVGHFGDQMIYLLLSPYADIQREFLDRVFFPIPFVEFNQQIVSSYELFQRALKDGFHKKDIAHNKGKDNVDGSLVKNSLRFSAILRNSQYKSNRPAVVHKDQGHFDISDYSILSIYGLDFLEFRKLLPEKVLRFDLSSLFLNQSDIHILRAIEPSLRLHYHFRSCDILLPKSEYFRCINGRRENIATKAQLSNFFFSSQDVDDIIEDS
ncbi:unnamed protein product [Dracunculus medinensis]|uniref:Hexosyltransferase n=1 Tax=Dracunculus medinensis TaxID=318479 RepID=A0A158Q2T5_DRAME|nr:unnamed protein product [Dracunculus medinensis]